MDFLGLLDIWGFYGKNGVLFGFSLIFLVDSHFCASEILEKNLVLKWKGGKVLSQT